MPDFLVFQLYGALTSWGDIAVGGYRPSQGQPSKSAITGLLAAALGIDREDDTVHVKLGQHYGVEVCVRTAGEFLRDYHTTQVPGGEREYISRREELLTDKLNLNTILSQRDYRTDAFYQIALWVSKQEDAPYTLEKLKHALEQPKFGLYLGRKSCPASLPLSPVIMSGVTLKQAFDEYPLNKAQPWIKKLGVSGLTSYFWEHRGLKTEELGMVYSMTYPRRDQVLSRKRWQFAARDEYYYAESKTGE